MGLLRALDRFNVNRGWKGIKQPDWQAWAAANGWTYQAEAPELAGRWTDGFEGAEEYRHLMTTTLHERPVTVFQRVAQEEQHWLEDSQKLGVNGFVIVGLPAEVAEPFASQRLDKTLRHFGVTIPPAYHGRFVGRELVLVHQGLHKGDRLQGEAELFALLIAMAPPELWKA